MSYPGQFGGYDVDDTEQFWFAVGNHILTSFPMNEIPPGILKDFYLLRGRAIKLTKDGEVFLTRLHKSIGGEKMSVFEPLKLMHQTAMKEGLWFYSSYPSFWASPEELEQENIAGNWRWDPKNWQLRDPNEYIKQAQAKMEKACKEVNRAVDRVCDWERETGRGEKDANS